MMVLLVDAEELQKTDMSSLTLWPYAPVEALELKFRFAMPFSIFQGRKKDAVPVQYGPMRLLG